MKIFKISRKIKKFCKFILRKIFEFGQRLGINIVPCHFYSEIPNFRELRENDYWKKPYSMVGIQGLKTIHQLNFVRKCCSNESIEGLKKDDIYKSSCKKNGESGYGPIEADFLYCFIRTKQPKRIVQIGCGVSTAVIILAAEEAGYSPEIICIDPYPTKFLIKSNKEGKIKLIQKKVQLVDMETLTNFGYNGFLFVDSTHTVKTGSDVNKIILEVLPRLKKGGWVHFHDIHFPYDYSGHILTTELFFSNETILLQSFLINNNKYLLRVALSILHYADPKGLKKIFSNYYPSENQYGLKTSEGDFPSSAYLEVVE